jgi:ABC-2 type transport system ATP-binding protein
MDEADKLCDRIAIVDHGKLAALDTPTRLKDSVPGTDVVEAEFEGEPEDWLDQLRILAQAARVTQRDGLVRIASNNGPETVAALMDLARQRGVTVKKVSVQSTTLDDVFLHFTGSQLRDAEHAGFTYDVSHLYK